MPEALAIGGLFNKRPSRMPTNNTLSFVEIEGKWRGRQKRPGRVVPAFEVR
jgi:hypothetical protein